MFGISKANRNIMYGKGAGMGVGVFPEGVRLPKEKLVANLLRFNSYAKCLLRVSPLMFLSK